MARIRSTGLNRSQLSALGSLLAYEQSQNDDGQGTFQGFGALGDTALEPSITGITGVDSFLYNVQDQLDTFKLAMTITTISSLAAAIAGVLLVLDR
jgi:hypothetical protein